MRARCIVIYVVFMLFQLILSEASHVYFDHKYEPHPEERGFTWARSHLSLKTIFQYSTVGEMTKLHPQLTKQIIGNSQFVIDIYLGNGNYLRACFSYSSSRIVSNKTRT